MKTEERYSNIPESLQPKIEGLLATVTKKATTICKRHDVGDGAIAALITDVTALLYGRYEGLTATLEQMREITTKVAGKYWDTSGGALPMLTFIYRLIVVQYDGQDVIPISPFWGIMICEKERLNSPTPTEANETAIANAKEHAQEQFYSFCVQIVGRETDATFEELKAIEPLCNIPDNERELALFMSGKEEATETEAEEETEEENLTPLLQKAQPLQQSLLPIYQNINAITANMELADKDEDIFKPLRIVVEENKRKAQELLKNPYTKEDDRRKAAQLISSTTAIYQLFDGLQLIAANEIPCSASTEYIDYELTPYSLTQICTTQQKPNAEQVLAILNAAEILRHSYAQAIEQGYRYIKGKKYNEQIKKRFQPIVLNWEERTIIASIPIAKVTKLTLSIHKIIVEGRSGGKVYYKNELGKTLPYYIAKQNQILLPEAAFTAFKTDEEKRFRATVLNVVGYEEGGLRKGRINEMSLLKKVFDYDARRKQLDDEAREAATLAAAYPEDEKLRAAAETAYAAAKQQQRHISTHMGRDVLKLSEMFTKAQDVGLISNTQPYTRREAKKKAGKTAKKGKYGENWVYEWTIREEKAKNQRGKTVKP